MMNCEQELPIFRLYIGRREKSVRKETSRVDGANMWQYVLWEIRGAY